MSKTKKLTKKEQERLEFRNNQLEYASKLQHLTPVHRKWIQDEKEPEYGDEDYSLFQSWNGEPMRTFEDFLDEYTDPQDKLDLVEYVCRRMNVRIKTGDTGSIQVRVPSIDRMRVNDPNYNDDLYSEIKITAFDTPSAITRKEKS